MRFIIAIAMCGGMITGCGAGHITLMNLTERTVIDLPDANRVLTINLGETLVAKGIRTTGKALQVSQRTTFGKEPGEGTWFICGLSVMPASQFFRGRWQTDQETADCYGPFNLQSTDSSGKPNSDCPGQYAVADICRDNVTGEFFIVTASHKVLLKQDSGNLAVVEKVVSSEANFVQELIYNGRSGDTLKFIYREFIDHMLRPSFSQDVQYDLAQSTEIGFKRARIEVIEASNTSITYRVRSNF